MAILSNGKRVAYGIKKFMVRTVEDILTIPLTPGTRPGSTVFVSSTQTHYILDQDYNWVELKKPGNGGESDDEHEEIIYEGGDISEDLPVALADYEGGQI